MGLNADEVYAILSKKIKQGGTGGGGVSVQSDYSQNDSTQPDYIKNRPFYSEMGEGEVLPRTVVDCSGENGQAVLPYFPLIVGENYTVKWNGTEYQCVAVASPYNEVNTVQEFFLGDIGLMTGGESTGEPFIIASSFDYTNPESYLSAIIPLDGSTTVVLTITGMMEIIHTLDEKYVPSSQFVVKLEQLDEVDKSRYTPDKTFKEIKHAFEQNKNVIAVIEVGDDRTVFKVRSVLDAMIEFDSFAISSSTLTYIVLTYNSETNYMDMSQYKADIVKAEL